MCTSTRILSKDNGDDDDSVNVFCSYARYYLLLSQVVLLKVQVLR